MSLARAHDDLVGRTLGEFVLRERIGEGGFGAVYRATQPALDREAVVKVLHARLHTSGAAKERFLREARLASKLDHPYAAHVYAFGVEPDGELWIAMELVRGTPLDQVLKVRGPMPLDRCVQLLDRICEVVHTAHEAGIVHRDLKPANVMVLARAGRVLPKLLDFGIAKGLSDGAIATGQTLSADAPRRRPPTDVGLAQTLNTPDDGLTQRGAIIGSPMYMAPEQWTDAGDVTARTDLYALGVLAYECLTGKPPFGGQTISAIASAHANEHARPLGPGFPGALDAVFAKVLAKAPEDRYADALVFAEAFRRASEVSLDVAPVSLPGLEPGLRDAIVNNAPQPIAEAVAAFAAARNIHQAHNALAMVVRTIARYVGLLAVACRSRVSSDDAKTPELLRELTRRGLADAEWIELARRLTAEWVAARDAYPIPELIGLFHGSDALAALVAGDAESSRDETLEAQVGDGVARLARVLDSLAFLSDYMLVVVSGRGVAERWMGVRRPQRTTIAIRGSADLPIGAPALFDKDGSPVLSLAPLFQVAPPTPGAPYDLFLFDGRGRRGAKLVALPSGFEHHDDGVWDWFRAQLTGSLDERETSIADEKPPYRGLSAFSADDGSMFFGREKLVDAFVNRLQIQPLLAVVGRSGAGKSSFIHAGVVPALPAETRTLVMRPGSSPIGALLARLEHAGIRDATREALDDREALGRLLRADAAARGPILLVVDQLEELFTLCESADERRVFAEAIAAAARAAEDPVRVVFTLRDDFLIRTEQIASLRNRIGQGLQLLTVPNADDMLRIVIEPARRLGYELEGELAQDMVREVADQPGALALISFTASKLWELRDRHFRRLTRAAYKTLGGVGGALARHAELTLGAMPSEEQGLTREAFRHLVTTQNTRAVLRRSELRQLLGTSAHGDNVIEKLVGARLLVASEDETGAETIEIVHEALLVAWPRLVDWRRDDSEGLRFREQLRSAAVQWHERGREKGLLWRGDALAEYAAWRARHPGPLTDLEAAFAGASTADARRGRRNLRIAIASAFAMLGAVVVTLVVLNGQATTSAERLQDTLRRQYEDEGRRYVIADQPLEAMAYLDKAARAGVGGPAHDLLFAAALRATDGELLEVSHASTSRSPQFSSDGKRLVTSGFDRVARLWDSETGHQLGEFKHRDNVATARLSPDGTLLATASSDGTAALWDVATGQRLHELEHGKPVNCVQFASDGRFVITAGDDDTLAVWDLPTAALRFRVHGTGAGFVRCAIAGDRVLAGDAAGEVRVWDRGGALVRTLSGHAKLINSLQVAGDGARLLTSSNDGAAILWELASGNRIATLHHGGEVFAALSPDGKTIATGSSDHTAFLWSVETGEKLQPLVGHLASIFDVAFSPDGGFLVTASADSTARLWETATGRGVAQWHGHAGVVRGAQFDPAGKRVATVGEDGRVILWAARAQDEVVTLGGHRDTVVTARFSPDSARVVTTSNDGTARIWDARTGGELAKLGDGAAGFEDAVYSPDGKTIATGRDSGSVELWDVATNTPHALPDASGDISEIAWSPDGALVAAGSADGSLMCWDVATRKLRFKNHGHGGVAVTSVAFGPDGRLYSAGYDDTRRIWDANGANVGSTKDADGPVTVSFDATGGRVVSALATRPAVKIWDVRTGQTTQLLVGHVGGVTSAGWSPDGAFVVTSSLDGTARVWDARAGTTLAVFRSPAGVRFARFSPDGRRVVIASQDRTASIFTLPRFTGTPAELEQLVRCRGTYDVTDGQLVPHPRELAACAH